RLQERKPFYVAAEYAPEYEKYGGPAGVEIAEQLFELSSEVALEVTLAGPDLWPMREPLCLRMMWDLVRGFHIGEKWQADFLRHAFWYWSGQDRGEAFGLRSRFAEAAAQRAAELPAYLDALNRQPLLRVIADEYHGAIAEIVRELSQTDLSAATSRLCFD